MTTGFHYRPEGLGLLLAWNDPEETPGLQDQLRSGIYREDSHSRRRPPARAGRGRGKFQAAWAGLYEMTFDHHPVLGPVAGLPGFFLANGFSGYGVMHSPATGSILADLIVHGKSDLADTDQLGLDRLASGRLIHETAVL